MNHLTCQTIILPVLMCVLSLSTSGQTCCSGGVPVSANLGFNSAETGILQVSVNGDFNFLKTLYAEGNRLEDDLRERKTQSFLLRASYALTNRISAETFIPAVRQTRKIYTNNNQTDFESSFGVGDPVLLLIYDVLKKNITFRIGAGPQFPLGSFTETNDQGLFLVEDLQPGSGAWDLILFSSLEIPVPSRPSGLFFTNVLISRNGTNSESRGGNQSYKFGNDIQVIGGYGDQVLIGTQIIQPSVGFRFRHANRDRIDGFPNSGTGGTFWFVRLSNGFTLPKDLGNLNLNIELPLDIQVNETQLAPTFTINIGWSRSFQVKDNSEQLILENIDL